MQRGLSGSPTERAHSRGGGLVRPPPPVHIDCPPPVLSLFPFMLEYWIPSAFFSRPFWLHSFLLWPWAGLPAKMAKICRSQLTFPQSICFVSLFLFLFLCLFSPQILLVQGDRKLLAIRPNKLTPAYRRHPLIPFLITCKKHGISTSNHHLFDSVSSIFTFVASLSHFPPFRNGTSCCPTVSYLFCATRWAGTGFSSQGRSSLARLIWGDSDDKEGYSQHTTLIERRSPDRGRRPVRRFSLTDCGLLAAQRCLKRKWLLEEGMSREDMTSFCVLLVQRSPCKPAA